MTLPALFAICSVLCAAVAGLIHGGALTGMGNAFLWLVVGLAFSSLAHLVYGKVGRQ